MLKSITLVSIFVLAPTATALAAGPTSTDARAETKHFRLDLNIGGMERMYTKVEAAKLHPKDGEIMVSGTMSGMPMGDMNGMATTGNNKSSMSTPMKPMAPPIPSAGDPGWRHLEVHVISKATDKAVRDAKVRIAVVNTKTKQHEVVPIAVMYGVEEGVADWHYGNNVMLPAGLYRIDVTANGEEAVLDVSIPTP